jgi:expansin (peptidoglycan-binding protein)
MCAEELEQTKRKFALPTLSDVAASSAAPVGQFSKRFHYAEMTFYNVGLNACDPINQPAGFVVALNAAQYNSGHHCGQCIRIRANGKTAVAQVVDECPSYEGEDLDLSKGLFEHFAPDAQGDLVGSWDFIDKYQHGHKVCLLVSSSLAFAHELSSSPA